MPKPTRRNRRFRILRNLRQNRQCYDLLESRRVLCTLTPTCPADASISPANELVIVVNPNDNPSVVDVTVLVENARDAVTGNLIPNRIDVRANGPGTSAEFTFDVDDFTKLRFIGTAENESILIDTDLDFDSILIGKGGQDDMVELGPGESTMLGGAGDDFLYGSEGRDRIIGSTGVDWLVGNSGNDILIAGDGDDFLRGGDGNDTMTGDTGSDFFLSIEEGDVLIDFDASLDKKN